LDLGSIKSSSYRSACAVLLLRNWWLCAVAGLEALLGQRVNLLHAAALLAFIK